MATLNSTAKSATANSYATLTEANTYHETVRINDEVTWLQMPETSRERHLMLATRLIDNHWKFIGSKTDLDQALQWPRQSVATDGKWQKDPYKSLDADTIPDFLKNATAELARLLIDTDVSADPDGAGFRQIAMAGLAVTFNEKDRSSQGVMRTSVYSLLRKYGSYVPSLNSSSPSYASARVER